jgi:hypothetical protein
MTHHASPFPRYPNKAQTLLLVASLACISSPIVVAADAQVASVSIATDTDEVDYRLVSSKKAMSASMYQRLLALGIDFPENNDNNTSWFGRMPVALIDDRLYLAMVKKDAVETDLAAKARFYALYHKTGVMTRNGQPYFAFQPEQIAHNIRTLMPQFSDPNQADAFIQLFAGKDPSDPDAIMANIQRDDQHRPEGKAANEAANLVILQALLDLKLATHPELQAQYTAAQQAHMQQQLNSTMDAMSNIKRLNDVYGYIRASGK